MQYADETVVVMNLLPVKPRDGVEDKTKGMPHQIVVTALVQKTGADAKGGRNLEVCLESGRLEPKVLKEHWKVGRYGRLAQNNLRNGATTRIGITDGWKIRLP